jgi:hypothetical protein
MVQEEAKAVLGFLPGLAICLKAEACDVGNCVIANIHGNSPGVSIVRRIVGENEDHASAVADIRKVSQAISVYYQVQGGLRVSPLTARLSNDDSSRVDFAKVCHIIVDIPRTPRDSNMGTDPGDTCIQEAYKVLNGISGNQHEACIGRLMTVVELSDRAATWLERMVLLWQAIECLVGEFISNNKNRKGMRAKLEALPEEIGFTNDEIKRWLVPMVDQNRLPNMASKNLTLRGSQHEVSQKLKNLLNGNDSAQDHYVSLLKCTLLVIYAWRNNVFHEGADFADDDDQKLTADCVIVMDTFVRAAIQKLLGVKVCGAKYDTGSIISLGAICRVGSSVSCYVS